MSDEMDDRRFWNADRGDERLGQRYRASATEEPPAVIDAAILAAARAQAQANTTNRPATARRRSQWQVPFSIAATVLLSVGLLLTLEREVPPAVPLEEVMLEQKARPAPAGRQREVRTESAEALLQDDADSATDQPMRQDARQRAKPGAAKSAEPVLAPPAPAMVLKKELRAAESDSLGGRDDVSAPAAFAGATAGNPSDDWSEEEWLAEIRRLREANKEAEAAALEQAYRERYPASVPQVAEEAPTK